jgi:hypothetical protein
MKPDDQWKTVVGLLLLPFTLVWLLVDGALSLFRALWFTPARVEADASKLNADLYQKALAGQNMSETTFIASILDNISFPNSEPVGVCVEVIRKIWSLEGLEIPKPPAVANSIEGARYRDTLSKLGDLRPTIDALSRSLANFVSMLPRPSEGLSFAMSLADTVTGEALQSIILPLYADDARLPKLQQQLNRNLYRMSGIPYMAESSKPTVLPAKYRGDEPLLRYIENTPLTTLFDCTVPLTIPHARRFEHTYVVGASGSGKTQLLQQLIAHDLESDSTVIVIDSKGDLISNIKMLECIDPERLVIIDPSDIHYPIALNPFDIPHERLKRYGQVEYERHINGVIDLLSYVFSSVLEADLTSKQSVLLNFTLRLLLHIPDATIHTLRELLEKDGLKPYVDYIPKLTRTGQAFFTKEFHSKEFDHTKSEVLRRIYGLIDNPTIERLFSHPRARFSMKEEMDQGKVILISTDKALLKNQCGFFGRFFISLIAQAGDERAIQKSRQDTYLYIDEAHDYVDEKIGEMYQQMRKYRIAMTIAHQDLAQLPAPVASAIITSSSTKFASGLQSKDARTLADDMRCDAHFIMNQPSLNFALYSKGTTERAVSVRVEKLLMEKMDKRSVEEMDEIMAQNRKRYSEPESPMAEPHKQKRARTVADPDDDMESLNKI